MTGDVNQPIAGKHNTQEEKRLSCLVFTKQRKSHVLVRGQVVAVRLAHNVAVGSQLVRFWVHIVVQPHRVLDDNECVMQSHSIKKLRQYCNTAIHSTPET